MARKAKADKAQAMAAAVRDVNLRDMVRGKLVSVLNVIPTDAQVDAAIASGAWAMTAPAMVTGATTAKPSKAPKAEPKAPPAWLVEKAQNRAARRELAAKLRAAGKPVSGPEWDAAKLAAGIK